MCVFTYILDQSWAQGCGAGAIRHPKSDGHFHHYLDQRIARPRCSWDRRTVSEHVLQHPRVCPLTVATLSNLIADCWIYNHVLHALERCKFSTWKTGDVIRLLKECSLIDILICSSRLLLQIRDMQPKRQTHSRFGAG